jgi:hypothetical protein
MAAGRLGAFFGDDWDEAFDSIKSVPGAFGNIVVAASRQVRLIDVLALVLVASGWAWIVFGAVIGGDQRLGLLLLAVAPSIAWLAAGVVGALVFEIGGIGPRVLGYWESYVLIVFFSLFGLISLRLALNPKDRIVYRQPTRAQANVGETSSSQGERPKQ